MNANGTREPFQKLNVGSERLHPQGVSVAYEQIVQYAIGRLTCCRVVPKVTVLDRQFRLRQIRADQVDHVALSLHHDDLPDLRVLVQGMHDEAQAEAGDKNTAVVEGSVILHCPPVRWIIDHPSLSPDGQGPDQNVCPIELMTT